MSNKPRPEDFPPESPHDLEWGGYNHEKYEAAIRTWEFQQQKSEPMSNNKDFQQKPPLGLMPEWLHKEKRLEEINAAIKRYLDSGKEIPHVWSIEYSELRQWLEENRQFKSANTVDNARDWEISAFRSTIFPNDVRQLWRKEDGHDGTYTGGCGVSSFLENRDQWEIFSVRRLSDNEVFSIGDVVIQGVSTRNHYSLPIVGFVILDNDMVAVFERERCPINYLKKAPKEEKKPVLTTEDGVGVFIGDSLWVILPDLTFVTRTVGEFIPDHLKKFSTLEAADNYITYNRKDYSLNDIKNAWAEGRSFVGTNWLIEQLLKINKEGGNK